MPKQKRSEKELQALNHRLEVLEGELGFMGAAQEKQELLALKNLIDSGEKLTEEQEDGLAELVFWYENECEMEGTN
jgi:hypothetical protein